MSPKTAEILKQALDLSVEERADLAGQLLESLESADSEIVKAAWDAAKTLFLQSQLEYIQANDEMTEAIGQPPPSKQLQKRTESLLHLGQIQTKSRGWWRIRI